jgi:hypothetical protein
MSRKWYEYELTKIKDPKSKIVIKSSPGLTSALRKLLNIKENNLIVRKGQGYLGVVFIYIVWNGELYHFSIKTRYVDFTENQLLDIVEQIKRMLI